MEGDSRSPDARSAESVDHGRLLDDRQLLAGVRAGHAAAFEWIVHRYSPELRRYCWRLGLTHHAADDVLQQSFMKAWVALEGGSTVHELRPWLFRIVHNAAVSALRDTRELPRAFGEDDGEAQTLDPRRDIDRLVAVRAALADVAALPPTQRDAIVMSAIHGRPRGEVAAALGVSETAVRGLLYRARATLRSAAAALTPPSVLGWAGGVLRKCTSAATRIAESVTPTGADAAGALTKGAGLALTAAAVLAGVAIAPHRSSSGHAGQQPPARVAGTTAVLERTQAPGSPSARLISSRRRSSAGTGSATGAAPTLSQQPARALQGPAPNTTAATPSQGSPETTARAPATEASEGTPGGEAPHPGEAPRGGEPPAAGETPKAPPPEGERSPPRGGDDEGGSDSGGERSESSDGGGSSDDGGSDDGSEAGGSESAGEHDDGEGSGSEGGEQGGSQHGHSGEEPPAGERHDGHDS